MAATLPDTTEYTEAVLALTTAQEAVEAITWRLQETVRTYEGDDAPAPTLEDVGALFALADELERLTADLTDKRDALQRILRSVNLARLEAAATAAAA